VRVGTVIDGIGTIFQISVSLSASFCAIRYLCHCQQVSVPFRVVGVLILHGEGVWMALAFNSLVDHIDAWFSYDIYRSSVAVRIVCASLKIWVVEVLPSSSNCSRLLMARVSDEFATGS